MHYNFFADREDKIEILQYIFNETDLHVYDDYSPYGENICEYKSAEEISSKFDLVNGGKFAVCFQLWSPKFKGEAIFRRVSLDPKRCNGHTFRYATGGWGLIQLQFGGQKNEELNQSHIGHFTERGALNMATTNIIYGSVDVWDWKEIQRTSSQLKRYIHNKLAVDKIDSLGILNGAKKLIGEGIQLR